MKLPNDQQADGRSLGIEEIANLVEAVRSGTLTATKGKFTKALQARFAEHMDVKHAFACNSGSMAVHCAVAAVDPEPGDEIITTSITDMGALAPIVYQGAIPRFADVDPMTGNVTAASIEACLSDKTKAIIVTHLFGNPAEMGPIMELARKHSIPVIEDTAQAYEATWNGRRVGTIGDIGCFSLQQGKQITTGEGGLVVTNDDAYGRRVKLFIDKAWGYGDPKPDHYFLALNGRMSELQGAVALAQLDKLEGNVHIRRTMAARLSEKIADLAGITVPGAAPEAVRSFWKYPLIVDADVVPGGCVALSKTLKTKGVWSGPRYIQKPAFRCQVFTERRTFGNSGWPFTLASEDAVDYSEARFPGTFKYLSQVLVVPINEGYTCEHIEYVANAIRAAHAELVG